MIDKLGQFWSPHPAAAHEAEGRHRETLVPADRTSHSACLPSISSCLASLMRPRSEAREGRSSSPRNATLVTAIPRARERLALISRLAAATPDIDIQPGPVARPKSLEDLAFDCGTTLSNLENQVRTELDAFVHKCRKDRDHHDQQIGERLHTLFQHVNNPSAPEWVRHARTFDTFIAHFCPGIDSYSKTKISDHVHRYMFIRIPEMIIWDRSISDQDPMHIETGRWMKLPRAWVDMRAVEEARNLAADGLPYTEKNILAHGTTSTALDGIGRCNEIRSSERILRQGGEVLSGEYVDMIDPLRQIPMTGGERGHSEVFATREGLSCWKFGARRWFDEFNVTFGIDPIKQSKHLGVPVQTFFEVKNGIRIGPSVPLANVVAITAPKANEAQIRAWIQSHCPHARFMSYEAADLVESWDMHGLHPSHT